MRCVLNCPRPSPLSPLAASSLSSLCPSPNPTTGTDLTASTVPYRPTFIALSPSTLQHRKYLIYPAEIAGHSLCSARITSSVQLRVRHGQFEARNQGPYLNVRLLRCQRLRGGWSVKGRRRRFWEHYTRKGAFNPATASWCAWGDGQPNVGPRRTFLRHRQALGALDY
jgi:hypothetical protein